MNTKIDIKYASKHHFRTEEEKQFYKSLLQIYQKENIKVLKDVEIMRRKIKKVDAELSINTKERSKIKPDYEEYKNLFDTHSQKLQILKDTKNLLKRDIFVKKQESKMLNTGRKLRRNHIKTIRRKQRQKTKSRNAGQFDNNAIQGNNFAGSMNHQIDYSLEYQKDKLASHNITQNNKYVNNLTQDVDDLEDRILALE